MGCSCPHLSPKRTKIWGRTARQKSCIGKKYLAVKSDKLMMEKPDKSKHLKIARVELKAGGGLYRWSGGAIEK